MNNVVRQIIFTENLESHIHQRTIHIMQKQILQEKDAKYTLRKI